MTDLALLVGPTLGLLAHEAIDAIDAIDAIKDSTKDAPCDPRVVSGMDRLYGR